MTKATDSCEKQTRHLTELSAQREAERLTAQSSYKKFKAVYCDFCRGWHCRRAEEQGPYEA